MIGIERRANCGVRGQVGVLSGGEGIEGVDGGGGDDAGRELKVATFWTSVAG